MPVDVVGGAGLRSNRRRRLIDQPVSLQNTIAVRRRHEFAEEIGGLGYAVDQDACQWIGPGPANSLSRPSQWPWRAITVKPVRTAALRWRSRRPHIRARRWRPLVIEGACRNVAAATLVEQAGDDLTWRGAKISLSMISDFNETVGTPLFCAV